MGETQIVAFGLNNEICGVETEQVYKIERYLNHRTVENMPEFVSAVFEHRGINVALIDLNKRFGLGESNLSRKTKLILSLIGESVIGFIVNEVFEIVTLSEENVENAPETLTKTGRVNYLKKVGKQGEKVISILDLSLILTQDEIKQIDAFENVKV